MDIKKTDSKGRISGFKPSRYYRLESQGLGVKIEELWFESAIEYGEGPLNDSGVQYLSSFGLDHRLILREGCHMEGYWERDLNEEGVPKMEYGALKKTRKPWPEGFDYDVFAQKALMLEE